MSELTLDYLTVTIRPEKSLDNITLPQLIDLFVDTFHIKEYLHNFQFCGSARYYAYLYRYNDIQFKVCSEDKIYRQGLCLEMSGNGFAHWVDSLPDGVTIRDVFRDFRALSVCGFKVNVPRLDVALDDIARGSEKPILRMSTISKKWANHEFCSRSQANSDDTTLYFQSADEGFFDRGKMSVNKKKGIVGKTIYFGHRKSSVYVRFYDKRAEQLQKGIPVDKDIISWVRCEYEYHNTKAMAVMLLIIENDYEEFERKYKRTVLGHLRFINNDDSNRSRCSTCSWWTAFLESVQGEDLASAPVKSVQFRRSVEWFRRSVAPTLWAFLACYGTVDFLSELKESGRNNIKARQLQLIEDFMNSSNDLSSECPNIWALLMSAYDYDDYESAIAQLKKDSLYINNLPAGMDSARWLQMVFADVPGVAG